MILLKSVIAISPLEWKLMMCLGQDEPIYTYTHPLTKHFVKEDCSGGRLGTNFREIESSANIAILNATRSLLKSNTNIISNLMQNYLYRCV